MKTTIQKSTTKILIIFKIHFHSNVKKLLVLVVTVRIAIITTDIPLNIMVRIIMNIHTYRARCQVELRAYVHGTYRRTETSTTWNTGRSFIGSSATAKMQQGDCLRYEDGASLLRQV